MTHHCQCCDATFAVLDGGTIPAHGVVNAHQTIICWGTGRAPAVCTHNRMVANSGGDARYAWKCADCGYVYGMDTAVVDRTDTVL